LNIKLKQQQIKKSNIMKAITQDQQTSIFEFLNSLTTEVTITDFVNIEDIDFNNVFFSIYETIDDNNGFDIEIIYYSNAIDYLQKNDPSLQESLSIASEYGYDLKNINSELLASLLASQNSREEFYELQGEIEDFFNELLQSNTEED
jgi:hypothetical protein